MTDHYTKTRPTITEQYTSAAARGGGRVGDDPQVPTPGDMIALAGMNTHRLGLSIMRLVSEWHSGAVPAAEAPPTAKQLIREGMAPTLAHHEAKRLHAQAVDWAMQEHMLRFQRLKTLPAVRMALLRHAKARGWEDVEHTVAMALRAFLAPVCHVCRGEDRKAPCRHCGGSGLAKIGSGRVRALVEHMQASTGTAAAELRNGRGMRRSVAGEQLRWEQRDRMRKQQRAEVLAEEIEDARQDVEAVREAFRM